MSWLGKSVGSKISGGNSWLGKVVKNGSDWIGKSKRVIGNVMDQYANTKKNIFKSIDNFNPELGGLARKGIKFVEDEIRNTLSPAKPLLNLMS